MTIDNRRIDMREFDITRYLVGDDTFADNNEELANEYHECKGDRKRKYEAPDGEVA